MATFVIETYLSRSRAQEWETAASRLRGAVLATSTIERPARHIRSFFVPEDEMCIHVVEAVSAETLLAISRLAGLAPDRIVEAKGGSG